MTPREVADGRPKVSGAAIRWANIDLGLAIACVAAEALVVGLLPDVTALRAVLGVVALLVVPGYVGGVALFPASGELSSSARVALSLALSLAIVALLGLALNFFPSGLHVVPLLTAVAILSTATSALALARRRSVVAPRRVSAPSPRRAARPMSLIAGGMSLVVLGGGVAIAGLGARQLHQSKRFTIFYVLDGTHSVERPPAAAPSSKPFRLLVGIENHEGRPVRYLLTASVGDLPLTEIRIPTVLPGATWQRQLQLRVPSKLAQQRLELELRLPGTTRAYRRLSLPIEGGGPTRSRRSLPRSPAARLG